MPLQNFECQIAKGQIGRYVAGEAFSAEALRQLEAHIATCPTCKSYLNERKSALQAMLGQSSIPAQPEPQSRPSLEQPALNPVVSAYLKAAQTPEPTKPGPLAIGKAMLDSWRPKPNPAQPTPQPKAAPQPTTGGRASFWKTFGYSAALAVVLGVMSLASRHLEAMTGSTVLKAGATESESPTPPVLKTPKRVVGGAAAQPLKARPEPAQRATGFPAPTATPPLMVSEPHRVKLKPLKPLVKGHKKAAPHVVASVEETPKAHRKVTRAKVVKRHVAKPHAHLAAKPHAKKWAKKAGHATHAKVAIRVYDADGNPVHE